MRSKADIEVAIEKLQVKRTELSKAYGKLSSIAALGSEGRSILEEVNNTIGKITALHWVLENSSYLMG